jgi:hypothetical protein
MSLLVNCLTLIQTHFSPGSLDPKGDAMFAQKQEEMDGIAQEKITDKGVSSSV